MRPPSAKVLIGLALLIAGLSITAHAAREQDPDPFRVHPDSLTRRHHSIAVGRVVALGASRIPIADTETRFAERIRDRLTTAGFSVVPAETVLAGWQATVASIGGIFDRRTGRRDTTRCRMADERMSQWLRDSLGCGLWLRYELVEVMADYDHGETRWDGTTAQIGAPGLLPTLILGFSEGKVPALSLELSLVDEERNSLYRRRAGLQTRSHMVKNRWLPVPMENLLDEGLTTRALDRALGPWVERVAPRAGEAP